MSVTMKQVAEAAGVSHQAVSQALNETGRISAKTRAKVLAVADDLGYRLNTSAKAMRSGRFHAIALLQSIHPRYSTLPRDVLGGIHDALDEIDFGLTLGRLPDGGEGVGSKVPDVPKILREQSIDGLLVNYTDHIPNDIREVVTRHSMPAIWMNCRLERDCIHHDDELAGRLATEHLLSLGHSKVVYVDHHHRRSELSDAHHSARDRYTGYLQAMEDAELSAKSYWRGDIELNSEGDPSSEHWLKGPGAPTAVVAYSASLACRIAYGAAITGLVVGRDFSLVPISGASSRHLGFHWTHVALDDHRLGREAVSLLHERLNHPRRSLPPRSVKCQLVIGESTAPPPGFRVPQ